MTATVRNEVRQIRYCGGLAVISTTASRARSIPTHGGKQRLKQVHSFAVRPSGREEVPPMAPSVSSRRLRWPQTSYPAIPPRPKLAVEGAVGQQPDRESSA